MDISALGASYWYVPFALLVAKLGAEAYVNLTGTPNPDSTWGKVYGYIEKAGGIWTALAKDRGWPSPLSQDKIAAAHALADNLVAAAKDIADEAHAVIKAPTKIQPEQLTAVVSSETDRVASVIATLKALGMIAPRAVPEATDSPKPAIAPPAAAAPAAAEAPASAPV